MTVPVLVRPDVPSLRTSGTYSVRVEDAERDSGWSWDSSTRLAVGPGGRRAREEENSSFVHCKVQFLLHFFVLNGSKM